MEKFKITGGSVLNGSIRISGAKNAALPILMATLLADGVSQISNVPELNDVTTTLALLSRIGCDITLEQPHQVALDCSQIHSQ